MKAEVGNFFPLRPLRLCYARFARLCADEIKTTEHTEITEAPSAQEKDKIFLGVLSGLISALSVFHFFNWRGE